MVRKVDDTDHWVCWQCGNENFDVQLCSECYSSQHAPYGTVKLVRIGQAFINVLVREGSLPGKEGECFLSIMQGKNPNDRFTSTLSTLNISSSSQWDSIVFAVEEQLFPKLGWKSAYRRRIIQQSVADKVPIGNWLQTEPEFALRIAKSIDDFLATSEPVDKLLNVHVIEQLLTRLSTSHADAFNSLLSNMISMDEEGITAIQSVFDTIASANSQFNIAEMNRRKITLDSLQRAIEIKKTREIELHKLFAAEPWLIDDKYSLWFSNQTFKVILGRSLKGKELQAYQNRRPDIGAVSTEGQVLIIELKRPNERVGADELHQLEDYLVVLRESLQLSNVEGVLLGEEHDPTIRHRIDMKNGITFRTYTDVLQTNRNRIQTYLSGVSQETRNNTGEEASIDDVEDL